MQDIEAYVAGGVIRGAVSEPITLGAGPDATRPVALDEATWHPLSGGPAVTRGRVRLTLEEVLILWADEHELPIHARWNSVELDIGPYHLVAELPTQPGFPTSQAMTPSDTVFSLGKAGEVFATYWMSPTLLRLDRKNGFCPGGDTARRSPGESKV